MPVLDQTQFNQLVNEVREALKVGSQGVSEVERVTSLDNLVSLPALRLIGATETVVEAPIELLSAPAVEAAADAREATQETIVAGVGANAAADRADGARIGLEEVKQKTIAAGNFANEKGGLAQIGAGHAEDATLHTMQVAAQLQSKLEQAQVIIIEGEASQEELDELSKKVVDSFLISVATSDEAREALLQLRELQAQVAQVIIEAYNSLDQMKLATDQAILATSLLNQALAMMDELQKEVELTIVESMLQTEQGKLITVRLEELEVELIHSQAGADSAAALARENADKADKVRKETERVKQDTILIGDESKRVIAKTEAAGDKALYSAAGADAAGGHATAEADRAKMAADRSNELSDNPPKIIDNLWYKYDETTKQYVSTGLRAKGDTGSSFNIVGVFPTPAELEAAVPDGADVDGVYAVGAAPPYSYYAWVYQGDAWSWQSQGELQGQRGESAYEGAVRLQGYTGTEEEYTSAPIAAVEFTNTHNVSAESHMDIRRAIADYLVASKGYTDDSIASLIGSAPEILDTLGELAEALLNNQSAVDAINNAIAKKLGKEEAKTLYVAIQGYVAYSQEEKAKLAGIEEGAQLNIIEKVRLNGEVQEVKDKEVDLTTPQLELYSENDDVEVVTGVIVNAGSGWNSFTFPYEFSSIPSVSCARIDGIIGIVNVQNVTKTGFMYQVTSYKSSNGFVDTSAEVKFNYIAITK